MRMLASFITGSMLSLVGTLLHGFTQNDLACPSTLGIYAYILIWPFIAIFFHPSNIGFEIFGLLLFYTSLPFLYFSSIKWETFFQKKFLLIGLCINLFIGSAMSFLHFTFQAINKAFPQYLWYGDFRHLELWYFFLIIPLSFYLYFFSKKNSSLIQLLSFGQELCLSFISSTKTTKIQKKLLFLIIIVLGTLTCFFGVFSFVALIFPHFLRQFSFFSYRLDREIRYGPFISGFIFMLLDLFLYHVTPWGIEFPTGLIFSTIGALSLVFFIGRNQYDSVARFK